MKHGVQELMAIAHELFPRGMMQDDPGYEQTPEMHRQAEALDHARALLPAFRALLGRLETSFPGRVEDRSGPLQGPFEPGQDRCFAAAVDLPPRQPGEARRVLELLVSFVAPYYVIHSTRGVPDSTGAPTRACSFTLSAEEQSHARTIAKEVEATFPGHDPMSPAVATTVVPDVMVYPGIPVTLLGCLFSDDWLRRARNEAGLWVWANRA